MKRQRGQGFGELWSDQGITTRLWLDYHLQAGCHMTSAFNTTPNEVVRKRVISTNCSWSNCRWGKCEYLRIKMQFLTPDLCFRTELVLEWERKELTNITWCNETVPPPVELSIRTIQTLLMTTMSHGGEREGATKPRNAGVCVTGLGCVFSIHVCLG